MKPTRSNHGTIPCCAPRAQEVPVDHAVPPVANMKHSRYTSARYHSRSPRRLSLPMTSQPFTWTHAVGTIVAPERGKIQITSRSENASVPSASGGGLRLRDDRPLLVPLSVVEVEA